MKHREKYRVHYYYTDRNFDLKLLYISKYMQETALAALDTLGAPRRELTEKKLAFFLSKMSFVFDDEIKKFDDIIVETWTLPPKSVSCVRNYRIINETAGTCAIRASSSWALLNIADKSIVHPNILSEHFIAGLVDDEDIGFNPARRVKIPDDIETAAENNVLFKKEILYGDIDENMHMNNTVYLDIIQNALWKISGVCSPFKLHSLDVSYDRGAVEGDCLTVCGAKTSGETGDEIYIRGKVGDTACFNAKACFKLT